MTATWSLWPMQVAYIGLWNGFEMLTLVQLLLGSAQQVRSLSWLGFYSIELLGLWNIMTGFTCQWIVLLSLTGSFVHCSIWLGSWSNRLEWITAKCCKILQFVMTGWMWSYKWDTTVVWWQLYTLIPYIMTMVLFWFWLMVQCFC